MYVGKSFKQDQFNIFQAFLSGVCMADLDQGSPPFGDFGRWITARTKAPPAAGTYWLYQELGSEAAYHAYLRYLDEYRTCIEIEVATVRRELIVPRFQTGTNLQNMHTPEVPDKLYIGRYAPSKVYFLAAMYDGRVDRDFPYFRTLSAAKNRAISKWSVPVAAWQRV